MTKALAIAAGAGLILVYAALMLLVIPSIQLAGMETPAGAQAPTQVAMQGRQLYVSLGCVYCHSQQPRAPMQTTADQAFGWGRASVPADYYYPGPHLLGTMRTGPDLFNIGARQPSIDWQLTHLYEPRAVVPWSIMPSYPFLFKETDIVLDSMREVRLPEAYQPANGHIVATDKAMALVKYLISMDHTYPVDLLKPEPGDEPVEDKQAATTVADGEA